LLALTAGTPELAAAFAGINANEGRNAEQKRAELFRQITLVDQAAQIKNPDNRISLFINSTETRLADFAYSYQGLSTGDNPRFRLVFWEIKELDGTWECEQSTVDAQSGCFGRTGVIRWEGGRGQLYQFGRDNVAALHNVDRRGEEAWGRRGVAVTQIGDLPVTLYNGQKFDTNTAVIVPTSQAHLAAIWAYCSSVEYRKDVRSIDQKLNVTNATLIKVPFDPTRWMAVATERYPNGLPEPYSDDPTQWLFHGHPARSESGTELHVALARLAGFRWPAESDADMRLSAEAREWVAKAATLPEPDADGVLPLLAVAGERPLADRLRDYLNVAIPGWDEAALVRAADGLIDKKGAKDVSLEAWLRDRAFRQHAALFHNRPFIWQVWDGQKDGFSGFLHYHRLDHALLQKLTYTLLGAWITRRQAENDERRVEAATILKKKLETILEGEAPHDIFVRWKPLEQQPAGWNPDLDDGVRLNIRPWVTAGVLRESAPKGIKWGVDRGKDISSAPWFNFDKGERNNDRHTTLAEKRGAREAAGARVRV
jgi:hypothetical protein